MSGLYVYGEAAERGKNESEQKAKQRRRSPGQTPTCMSALVDLEVLGAREDLAAARERAGEGLLAGVHADVVDELVLGLEGLAFARTVLPEADVAALLWATHVLHHDMVHQLVHGAESFGAGLGAAGHGMQPGQLLRVQPLADELPLDWLPPVVQKGPGRPWEVGVARDAAGGPAVTATARFRFNFTAP